MPRLALALRPVFVLTLCTALAALPGCVATPPNPNPHAADKLPLAQVDLPRYMGRWYNIAHIPYFGENGYVGSYSEWSLRPDGDIDDVYVGHKDSFLAPETRRTFVDSVEPNTGNADWKVHLLGPIGVHQLTLYVDANYEVTLLGYSDKSLGWIFARTPTVTPERYAELIGRLDAMGYDTRRFVRVPQEPDQIGQPGFVPVPIDAH